MDKSFKAESSANICIKFLFHFFLGVVGGVCRSLFYRTLMMLTRMQKKMSQDKIRDFVVFLLWNYLLMLISPFH